MIHTNLPWNCVVFLLLCELTRSAIYGRQIFDSHNWSTVLVDEEKLILSDICVDHYILLLKYLSNHMHFITNGYKHKATCSFKDTGHYWLLSKTSLLTWWISTFMHKITNLWKFELNRSSKFGDTERKKHPFHTELCFSDAWFRDLKSDENYFSLEVTSEGAVSNNVLYYQPLPITRFQVRFCANNYFE